MMYVQDYDETMVPYLVTRPGGGSVWWHGVTLPTSPLTYRREDGLIQPYMKNVEIQDCPVGRDLPTPFNWTNGQLVPTYGVNRTVFVSPSSSTPAISLAAVQQPADTLLMVDAANATDPNNLTKSFFISPPWDTRFASDNGGSASSLSPRVHGRHSGDVACALWADGHVSVVRPQYRPAGSDAINDRRRDKRVGELSPVPLPAAISAGDPAIPRYNYYFALDKSTGN